MDETLNRPASTEVFGVGFIPADVKMLNDLNKLIEETFKQNRDPEYYGKALNVTMRRLNRLTDMYYGRTVYQHLQFRIHQEVEKLLKHTTLTAKEIAIEVGMLDQAYLSRCFKKITGMTPVQFRRENQVLVTITPCS